MKLCLNSVAVNSRPALLIPYESLVTQCVLSAYISADVNCPAYTDQRVHNVLNELGLKSSCVLCIMHAHSACMLMSFHLRLVKNVCYELSRHPSPVVYEDVKYNVTTRGR